MVGKLCSALAFNVTKRKYQTDYTLPMTAGVATVAEQQQQDMQVGSQSNLEPI